MSAPDQAVAVPPTFPDLAEVKGQEAAKRALEIAAAGNHPIQLMGSMGSGKTLLVRCLPSLLPAPTEDEAAAIAEVYRRAKHDPPPSRPFRAPHFSTRPLELVGRRKPGEVDLARGGVLLPGRSPGVRTAVSPGAPAAAGGQRAT